MQRRTLLVLLAFVLVASLIATSTAGVPLVQAASTTITSAGPLTSITISDELNCAVNHTGDVSGEFFGDTACATEIAAGGAIYGPSSIPAGNSPGGYTPVSQSAVTGSGTSGDPFTIVTVVDVGTTGLRITETDSYVVGLESYRSDVQVTNTNNGAQAQNVILYRGGDCYLQNSDEGFGSIGNPTGAVACVAAADPNNPSAGPGSRIEQWVPLTAGSHYYEAFYSTVWDAMSAKTDFPDACECATYEDNGAGLSWALNIPAGQSQTVSHLTNFSPLGNVPLSTTKTADQGTVAAGGADGYTITVSNPNASSVQLSSISDTLPAGFSYIAGSTTGVTTSNPAVAAQTLTWTGTFTVPAASGSTSGTVSLHFGVTASSTPGEYFNNASAEANGGFTVLPSGNTAPIVVSTSTPTNTPTATNTATNTPTATNTSVPATATNTPTATDTSVPATATNTPTPTPTNTPVLPTNTSTPTSTPLPGGCLRADVNGDGAVGVDDLVLVARAMPSAIGHRGYDPRLDLNQDGRINVFDLMVVLHCLGRAKGN